MHRYGEELGPAEAVEGHVRCFVWKIGSKRWKENEGRKRGKENLLLMPIGGPLPQTFMMPGRKQGM